MNLPLVLQDHLRPAGQQDRCFYCKEMLGEPHAFNCVMVCQRVKVKVEIEYDVWEPISWDGEQIEFRRNEGSWCANNCLDEITAFVGGEDIGLDGEGCLCPITTTKFVQVVDPTPTIRI